MLNKSGDLSRTQLDAAINKLIEEAETAKDMKFREILLILKSTFARMTISEANAHFRWFVKGLQKLCHAKVGTETTYNHLPYTARPRE